MTTSAVRIRAYDGPAILSFGFRPLFLAAAAWSAIAMALWIPLLAGAISLPTAFDPVSWHAHELLYGYLPAVAAGFLLTAVPNWTGRLPVTGTPLLVLVLAWLAGRLAVLFSALIGPVPAAAVDLAFLVLLSLVIGREVLGGRNWRNLKVLVLIALLAGGNALFHVEALRQGTAVGGHAVRLGTAVSIFLVILIGGRIVPSFTRNWLAKARPGRLPAPFDRFDQLGALLAAAALLSWIALPEASLTASLCLLAGALHLWRLGRWAGHRTWPEPLVWVLHVGYAFVPLGFLAIAAAVTRPTLLSPGTAMHAWTAGVVGVMTLAVMTRASLGHSGRPLTASAGTVFVYGAVIAAALLRLASGFVPDPTHFLHLAGAAWIVAFAAFVILYAPLLACPRAARRRT